MIEGKENWFSDWWDVISKLVESIGCLWEVRLWFFGGVGNQSDEYSIIFPSEIKFSTVTFGKWKEKDAIVCRRRVGLCSNGGHALKRCRGEKKQEDQEESVARSKMIFLEGEKEINRAPLEGWKGRSAEHRSKEEGKGGNRATKIFEKHDYTSKSIATIGSDRVFMSCYSRSDLL